MDFSNIVKEKPGLQEIQKQEQDTFLPEPSEDFVDDPDVPPLM